MGSMMVERQRLSVSDPKILGSKPPSSFKSSPLSCHGEKYSFAAFLLLPSQLSFDCIKLNCARKERREKRDSPPPPPHRGFKNFQPTNNHPTNLTFFPFTVKLPLSTRLGRTRKGRKQAQGFLGVW